MIFQSFDGKQDCDEKNILLFGRKWDFFGFDEKQNYTILARKWNFIDLVGKWDFTILARKRIFAIFWKKKKDFFGFGKKIEILRFL